MKVTPPGCLPARRAFFRGIALIELLIVIAILSLLGGFASVILNRANAAARQLKCASNLRQIGVAVNAYATDNGGQLPGPIFGGQPAYYTPYTKDGFLLTFLAPYLNLPLTPKTSPLRAEIFVCPAWKAAVPRELDKPFSRIYVMQNLGRFRDGTSGFPFGYPKSGDQPEKGPVRMTMLESPAQTAVMWDLDHYSIDGFMLNTSVHSGKRNYLYFDGRVELR